MSKDSAMSIGTAGELFQIRALGMVAGMFHQRGVEPTSEQWEIIRDQREITVREIAEIAYDLSLFVDIVVCDRTDAERAGEAA